MGSQPAIECRQLSRMFDGVAALQPLDLVVPQGAVFGFLGRNGAGKTTTMRLLTGLAEPSSGEAWVDGVRIERGEVAGRERFGFLPEEPSFYEWMSPRELLDFVGRLFLLQDAERSRRVEELLSQVGLLASADRPIRGFSRGMRQRLGLAQALVNSPPVLFLDEPTSALDPAGRHEVLNLIEAMRGRVTIFLSSHILGDVERVCDTIGILHQGRLVRVAPRDELLAEHLADTLVIESEGTPISPGLRAAVEASPWAKAVASEGEGRVLRIKVSDVASAKREVLPMLVAHGLPWRRLEWVRPSLEDVFLEMSG